MARTIFWTAFSLLFFVYIKQGLHAVEVSHHETVRATVGQNISLPCSVVKQQSDSIVTSIQWRKKDARNNHKPHNIVVYDAVLGTHLHWPNVSFQLVNDDQMPNVSVPSRVRGSILHLGAVEGRDSGVYLCDTWIFPHGLLTTETKLKVKGVKIECDRNRSITASPGENVTIRCSVDTTSDTHYSWTKDKRPLSYKDSLQLWRVGDAEAGSYTLAVQTGNYLLHAVFNITVLARNTSLETESTPSNVTEEYLNQTVTPSESTHMTYPSPGYADASAWTMGVATNAFKTDVTSSESTPSNVTEEYLNQTDQTVTPSESTHMTSPSPGYADTSAWTMGVDTNAFKTDVTSSGVGIVLSPTAEVNVSATHSDRFTTSTDPPANTPSTGKLTTHAPVTHRPVIWFQSYSRNANGRTTLASGEPGALSTQEISNNSDAEERVTWAEMDPDAADDTWVTTTTGQEDTSSVPGYLWLIILFVILILTLVVLVGFLYRIKHTIKKKMDQPPPFKPPPPPTKYTSLIPQEFPVTDVIITTV